MVYIINFIYFLKISIILVSSIDLWKHWFMILIVCVIQHITFYCRFEWHSLIHHLLLLHWLLSICRIWRDILGQTSSCGAIMLLMEGTMLAISCSFRDWFYLKTILMCCLIHRNDWNFAWRCDLVFNPCMAVVQTSFNFNIWIWSGYIHISWTGWLFLFWEAKVWFFIDLFNLMNRILTLLVINLMLFTFRVKAWLIKKCSLSLMKRFLIMNMHLKCTGHVWIWDIFSQSW